MNRFVFVLALAACDPPPQPVQPIPAASQSAAAASGAPTQNIDVRVEFEKTSDQYSSYISAFVTIPAMNVHVQLFAVPFPYGCSRGETDASDELVVRCQSTDGYAQASVRIENGHVIATGRDYGRINADKTVKDLALPPNATATIFTPQTFPEEH